MAVTPEAHLPGPLCSGREYRPVKERRCTDHFQVQDAVLGLLEQADELDGEHPQALLVPAGRSAQRRRRPEFHLRPRPCVPGAPSPHTCLQLPLLPPGLLIQSLWSQTLSSVTTATLVRLVPSPSDAPPPPGPDHAPFKPPPTWHLFDRVEDTFFLNVPQTLVKAEVFSFNLRR